MADELEKRIVEAMARAMCIAQGANPDADDVDGLKGWELSLGPALRQYRAHRAMLLAMLGPEPLAMSKFRSAVSGTTKQKP